MTISAAITPTDPGLWLRSFAAIAVGAVHVVYWARVHRINRLWLHGEHLGRAGSTCFATEDGGEANEGDDAPAFLRMLRRWEWGHVLRAVLAGAAVVAALLALV